MLSRLDCDRLHEALELAEHSIGLSDPNPRVGCVIGHSDGRVLGRGYTQQAGGPHAEIVALRAAEAAGADPRSGTAWVTLEPCAHHGRTPPCCDALIAAGLKRVVIAIGDPFVQVAGAGIARLRGAGVEVALADGAIAAAAREINIGFFSRVERGRPWVRLKVATSLDGRTALDNGVSQWITGEAARHDGHAWRRRAGAVLTGIGTALEDDPRLDVRHLPTARQPLRVVVDSRLRLPPHARVLQPPGAVRLYCAHDDAARRGALEAAGATVHLLPAPDGQVDLAAVLGDLAAAGVNEVHVEAGQVLNGALAHAGLVDEWLVYLAPIWVGPGRGAVGLEPLVRLVDAHRLQFVAVDRVGDDLRLRARPLPATRP